MEPYEKIAKILRTDKDVIKTVEEKIFDVVGHNDSMSNIVNENKTKIEEVLETLKVKSMNSDDIFRALLLKIGSDDDRLRVILNEKREGAESQFGSLLRIAKNISGVKKGKFLKLEKAKELMIANPPQNIINFLGYKDAHELVEKEDIFEIFAALRFVEKSDWLNKVFFKPYEDLTPDDFEEREINVAVLDQKWLEAAEKFVKKKYHNLSHLKELGLIFVIPMSIERAGETIRTFTLALHYCHEVEFYSDLFKKYAEGDDFAERFVSSLRGDVSDERPSGDELGKKFLITQRYLAKDDEYDWRLFYPHVNPESIHWAKAEHDLAKFSKQFDAGFDFWDNLDFVGDFFKDGVGVEVLVSFNLIDNAMALFMKKEMIKYLYHHQESMWNKIFAYYFGEKEMEEMIKDNFNEGVIDIEKLKVKS